jgi:hypothetical protein
MVTDPLYVMEVEPLDLGADVKAVGLDLVEIESREPVHGADAAKLWAATLAALPATEPWGFDFFSHLDRVREYCRSNGIRFEEKSSGRTLVIPSPSKDAGAQFAAGDPTLEGELAKRGVDAYHNTFKNYLFCAVCDFENGFLTLLTEKLWTSEVLRRIKPATADMPVEVARPQ